MRESKCKEKITEKAGGELANCILRLQTEIHRDLSPSERLVAEESFFDGWNAATRYINNFLTSP
jgi:hypothetical protein